METINHYFFRDVGVTIGRSMRHILRSRDAIIAVAIVLIPIAFVLLLVYIFIHAIQTLEDVFFTITRKEEEIKQEQ